ncbi:MAG: hypothetical protein QOF01_4741, partial [Thermomicrobiales bacterium]|nr:hypothetical protein [Thermomicrobiales bacterium]
MAIDATLKEDAPLGQNSSPGRAQTGRTETAASGELSAAQMTRAVLLLGTTAFCFQV